MAPSVRPNTETKFKMIDSNTKKVLTEKERYDSLVEIACTGAVPINQLLTVWFFCILHLIDRSWNGIRNLLYNGESINEADS